MKPINYPSFDQKSLHLMLVLRISGFSINSLAFMFYCSRPTIRKYCKEYNIKPEWIEISINEAVRKTIESCLEDRWTVIDGQRVNKGNSYSHYLKSLPRK